MARPTGWDILGLDGDPTPGVVESVQALAKQFGDFAHDVESAYRSLNSFGADANALQWIGQSAEAFKGKFGPLPGRLQKLYTSYSEASDALAAYAPKLQAAQTKADTALRQAQDAHADLQRATTNANNAAADLKTAQQNHAANPNPQAVADAQSAHDAAQTNLNNAKAKMAELTKQANDAASDRIDAAKACATALHHAQSDGIHNKSWWQHVAEDLSEWGGKIAEIANDLAPFLDVLALATSWIPGVDVVTAALAEADNIIAMVGTGMEVLGDAMQGHWGDALMGAGMLGATLLGGKALEKVGGKLFEKIGARGNKLACEGGDPVDVVSGNMITAEADVNLPGILPLVLRRAYSSAHPYGRLFGAGWSSTLDVRVCVNDAGIHFAGDDSQVLHFPIPEPGQSVLPQDGARWPLEWDRETDEIRITDPVSAFVWRFAVVHHLEDAGQIRDLTTVTDRNDNEVRFLRDASGIPIAVEHSGGYRLLVDSAVTGAGPRVTGLRLMDGTPEGVTVRTFGYDERGRLTEVVDSSGEPFRYEYDEADRITAWQDRLGYRYAYEYDDTGRVCSGTGGGGFLSATFHYDDENQANTVVDSLGRRIVYRYDENGNLTSITDPLGNTLTTVYDRYGRLKSGTDALGRTTTREYDEFGNTTRITRPDGTEITGVFVASAKPAEVGLPDGTKWRYRYDDRGRLTTVVDPAGAVTEYRYDARGGVREVVDPLGAVTVIATDGVGLPARIQESDGGVTHIERDAFGRIVSVTQPDGVTVTAGWSIEGLPLWEAGPDGIVSSRTYDAEGRLLAHTDVLGVVTRFEYGPFGTSVARTDPNGARYEFAYDTELTLTSVTNPAGAVWSYDYDAGGRLVAERDFTGRELRYRHDAAGRLIARVNGLGQTTELAYGALDEIVQRNTADGVYSFAYDRAGRLVTASGPGTSLAFTRDEVGRITAESVNGRTVGFAYNAAGRRIQRTTPSGAESVWDYDLGLKHARLTTSSGTLDFAFDAVGRETGRVFGADVRLTQGFDAEGRLTEQRLWRGDAPSQSQALQPARLLMERTYSYRADNAPVQISDSLRGTRKYGLDRLGRVVAVQAATWNESYAYDEFGNVAHAAASGGPDGGDTSGSEREFVGPLPRRAGRTHYDYDEQGRLVRAVRRTLSGQRKQWTYQWDADDRLVQTSLPDGVVWTYSYDPLGRRTGKQAVDPAGALVEQIEFSWDGGTLIEQVSWRGVGGEAVIWDYDPLTEPWRPVAQRRRRWTDEGQREVEETFHTVVTDAAGTPAELVAADGSIAWHLTTSLFGTPVAVSEHEDDCPLRFPGQYLDDETGLHYNVHRYYDPQTATYLSPDPLGLAPSPNDHGYTRNPLTEIDPLGLLCDTALAGIKDRVDTLHALNGGGSGYRTTAIIRALDHNGKEVDVVGWSGSADKALNPKILNALGNNGRNEIPAMAVDGDAEVSALATIRANGWTPLGGAASRPVCPWCQNELFEPFSANVGGVQLRGPFDFTQIKMRPGKGGTIASHPLGGRLTGQSQFTW